MECRDKSATPGRKLIQARLPFKRLNPVPKEKLDGNSGAKKARNSPNVLDQNTLCASLSSDNVENGGEAESEPQFVSKLVNGKGPLDVFVQKGPKNRASEPLLVIDLVGNSCHRLTGNTEHVASGHGAKEAPEKVGNQAGTPRPPCGATEDIQMETSPAPAEKDESKIGTHSAKQSKLSNIIFERKLPVVVLEDIMARSPRALPLERSLASETMESIPEEDTAGTSSSLSSLSLASSPESLSTRKDTHVSPLAASTPARKVSQKTHQSAEEKEKLKLQKDQERAEKGRLKEEAKAAKERAREEARRKKEEEKELKEKERKEKKEKDEKEKAEKLRVKEEKRKEKQEALEAKLEEKRKKEEEKRLKEEEKRLKEEEKRIKAEKAGITRFFQKPKTQPVPKTLAGWCGKFAPFEIKENMVLAPLCRAAIDLDLLDHFDWLLQAQDAGTTFLEELKGREPCRSGPTLVADVIGSDVVVVVGSSQAGDVPDRKTFGRMKLLQFCENHRPAYWGTWNKKSRSIRPRNPWSKDEKLLDYEVESDEEWEEEEPGESLSHSEGDDDDEGGEEEDEDDGFFVPHGYLSEDEGVTEECDPENHKARQKLKAKEWDELLTKGKRFRVLQPVKVGCVWEGAKDGGEGTNPDARLLHQFAVAVLDSSLADEEQTERNNKKKTKNQQILGQLLPLLHGNVHGSKVIIQEFQECCRRGLLPGTENPASVASGGSTAPSSPETLVAAAPIPVPSKARLKRIISENSVYEKRPERRMCWYVQPEVLRSYGREDLPVPCQWDYVTQVPAGNKEESGNSPGGTAVSASTTQTTPLSVKRRPMGSMSITKFMKKTPGAGQAETAEMDGFQADTEEDDEDDCILVEPHPKKATDPKPSEPFPKMEQTDGVVA
ncbi:chromatin assembly factor 1 subunit A [Anolis carolinensis]|uniref:chromatin assembly factor 1 subunit A n=1 Tax=Anolis carolinensis TaxID=28377 RepID=UPI00046265CA|nr:PREDICTED: chromatin assembly factor 1 subunit A [Anolis carolinensis]|eukprot:XP_008121009.1 PREDICTED: chromatin assembly factor 1 subunit A [Anolis carolinensis]